MFAGTFIKPASIMLLELIISVGSIRIDRKKEVVDDSTY